MVYLRLVFLQHCSEEGGGSCCLHLAGEDVFETLVAFLRGHIVNGAPCAECEPWLVSVSQGVIRLQLRISCFLTLLVMLLYCIVVMHY